MSAHRANQQPIPGIASNSGMVMIILELIFTMLWIPILIYLLSNSLVDGGISVPAINHPVNGSAPT